MASKQSTTRVPNSQLIEFLNRNNKLLTLAARRGYSQRALTALALSAITADANRPVSRKAVRRA